MRSVLLLILSVALVTAAGCGGKGGGDVSSGGKPVIMTTFFPLTWVVRTLAGDDADVRCPVPADTDPSLWMPPDDVVAAYQAADLVVINGASYERWVARVSLPPSRVLDATAGVKDQLLHHKHAITHSHGRFGPHVHRGLDGHTWLDPLMLLAEAQAVRDGLTKLLPEAAERISASFQTVAATLHALDDELRAMTRDYDGPALYATHPAYNYLAKRYGLHVINIALDPEARPTDEEIARVQRLLEKDPARFILWEEQPVPEAAKRVKEELGLTSVLFTPCETPAAAVDGSYEATMRANVDRLRKALEASR